jgi:hypothetical protein
VLDHKSKIPVWLQAPTTYLIAPDHNHFFGFSFKNVTGRTRVIMLFREDPMRDTPENNDTAFWNNRFLMKTGITTDYRRGDRGGLSLHLIELI